MPEPVPPILTPRVMVLLATRNGMPWIDDQVASIFAQSSVTVRVLASDDDSHDGTRAWLENHHVELLPARGPSGSAAANFYRLLTSADFADDELVAFADQDDVWMPNKLARHAALLTAGGFDGISSNVTAFGESGRRILIRKDFPQRDLDYLLESPGPGSTFLMTARLARAVAEVLIAHPEAAEIEYHDWLVYTVARARGWRWLIDSESTVDYRQHAGNAMGANLGTGAARSRLQLIRARWHRGQAARLARIAAALGSEEAAAITPLLESTRFRDRFALAANAGRLRRRPRDRAIIGVLIATGFW